MILGDVEEIITTVVIDEETYEEIYKVCFRYFIAKKILVIALLQFTLLLKMLTGCTYLHLSLFLAQTCIVMWCKYFIAQMWLFCQKLI